MLRRVLPALAAVLVVSVALPLVASGQIDQPTAGSLQRATRAAASTGDVVTVYNSGPLRESVAIRAMQAGFDAGGTATIGRSASVGMVRLRRGASTVQQPASGFLIPMGTTVLPLDYVRAEMGDAVSSSLGPTQVVMGQLTASLRGARQGDVMTVVGAAGNHVNFTIARIAADAVIGGTEILMTPDGANRIGLDRVSRVVIWGFDSRAAINSRLAAHGLVSTSIRIRRSWDPADPDSTLGMAETKQALGEFSYRVNANGSVTQDSAWRTANITSGSIHRLRLYTGCHRKVRPALQAAMNEVVASGLEFTINYQHANSAGGCYYPRFNRLTPDSRLGFLSRHSWGQAVDTNTVGSCQGCAPPDMDCRTVRIFRKHGFAWGGNFLTPDGMHFEWVGERRDQLPYPSRFCRNTNTSGFDLDPDDLPVEETERARLFADDGLEAHGDHTH